MSSLDKVRYHSPTVLFRLVYQFLRLLRRHTGDKVRVHTRFDRWRLCLQHRQITSRYEHDYDGQECSYALLHVYVL